MKEIQGKIKFGVIPLRKVEEFEFITLDESSFEALTNEQMDNSYMLSGITEEQAAEFVEESYHSNGKILGYKDYFINPVQLFQTAKESLISLLKANGIETKEMADNLYDEVEQLPDDLLLIKL